MKGIFKFTTAALALVALASCSNDDLLGTSQTLEGQAGNALKVEIEDLVDPVTTRAAYVPDGTSNKLYWQNWDGIYVYDDALLKFDYYQFSEKRGTFENNSKDNVKTPVFAFTEGDNTDYRNSYFNAGNSGWDSKTDQVYVSYHIGYAPTTGVDDEIASTKGNKVKAYEFSIPMWGEAKSEDGKVSVSLKYLTGVLRVQLAQLPSDVAQIRVRGYLDQACNNAARMTGDFKAVVSEDGEIDPDAQLVPYPVSDGVSNGNALIVNFEDWDAEDVDKVRKDGGYVYLPLIAQDYGALVFEYSVDGTNWTLIKKTKPVSVKRGNVYRMNIEELEIAGSDAESVNVLLQQKKDETGAVVIKTTYPTEVSQNDAATEGGTIVKKNVISIPAGMAAESVTLDLAGITSKNSLPFEVESEDGQFAGDFVLDLSDGTVTDLKNIYLNLPNSNVVLKGNFGTAILGTQYTGTTIKQNKLIVKSLTIAAVDQDDLDKGNANTTVGDIYPNYESFSTGDGIVVAKGATVGDIDMTRLSENGDKYIAKSSIEIKGTAKNIKALVENPAYTADKEEYYAVIPVTVDGGKVNKVETASDITIKGKATVSTSATSKWGNITAAGESTSNQLTATNKKIAMSEKATAANATAPTIEIKGSANVTSLATATTLSITETAWAQAATVNDNGAATINLSQEQEAVKGTLTLSSKAALTLTQGYINTITGTSAKVTFGEGEGFTAIGTASGLTAVNASTWNGKKIGSDFAATYANKQSVWTACMLATNDFKAGIKLENNIDLNSQAWTPVADPAAAITINGNKKAIKSLSVTGADDNGSALIKSVANATTIQDLTIDGAAISASAKNNVAVLIGKATGAVTVSNTTIKSATVTGKYFLGGVVGQAADVTATASNLAGVTFSATAAKQTVTTDDKANKDAGSVGFLAGKATGTATVDAKSTAGTLNRLTLGFKENFETQADTDADGNTTVTFYYYYPGTTFVGIFGGTAAIEGLTDQAGAKKDAKVEKGVNYYLLNSKWD